jgi:gamma-aminobutyric acid type B receptor
MALVDVNAREDILPGYTLVLHWKDSGVGVAGIKAFHSRALAQSPIVLSAQCQAGLGARGMYELLYNEPTKIMLLSGCSPVATIVAEAANMWNLLVVGAFKCFYVCILEQMVYGAESPELSNRARFPTLFRTHPSAVIVNPARVKLFNDYGWKKVAILQSVEGVFTSVCGLSVYFITCVFRLPKTWKRNVLNTAYKCLVRASWTTRQMHCLVYDATTHASLSVCSMSLRPDVFSARLSAIRRLREYYAVQLSKMKQLYGRRYQWLLIGWYDDDWFVPKPNEHLGCTLEEVCAARDKRISVADVAKH